MLALPCHIKTLCYIRRSCASDYIQYEMVDKILLRFLLLESESQCLVYLYA